MPLDLSEKFFERFGKRETVDLLNERQDIAELATGPTAIALPAWIDVEGRTLVVVKRTESLVSGPGRA